MENVFVLFFTSLGIGLTGAVMPGPLLALTLKESVRNGKWAALWLSCGHSFCELLMLTALVAGLTRILSPDVITGPVGILGGLILLWMGVGALKQARNATPPEENKSSKSDRHSLLVNGAAVTLANPYWTLWWLTAGLALVLIAVKSGPAGIAAFYLGHISSDFLWFGLVGLAVGSGRRLLEGNLYRNVLRACGFFLLLFGLMFLGYGVRLIHLIAT